MKLNSILFIALMLAPPFLMAQAESIFNGVAMGDSFHDVREKLAPLTENTKIINVPNPSFPLAKNRETHLVCKGVRTNQSRLDQVIFTFADDVLVHIEARGNTLQAFTAKRADTASTYLDYIVYPEDRLFLKKANDRAWILNDGGMHANLFAWENPFAEANYKPNAIEAKSRVIPAYIRMGETLETLKPVLEANSLFSYEEALGDSDPNAQLQLNCFGVTYMGFPRKVEARFGDNKLNVVWILTGKGEEGRIRDALVAQFGDPVFVDDAWEIYNNWQVGLRKDIPEVLLMEQQIGLQYKTSYFKQE